MADEQVQPSLVDFLSKFAETSKSYHEMKPVFDKLSDHFSGKTEETKVEEKPAVEETKEYTIDDLHAMVDKIQKGTSDVKDVRVTTVPSVKDIVDGTVSDDQLLALYDAGKLDFLK